MPSLLLEIGCEELPAAACHEAEIALRELAGRHLGVEPTRVLIGPRRLAVVIDDLPEVTEPEWIKGPPATAPEQARAGFARRHGLEQDRLEERDGSLGFERPGERIADVLPERLAALVGGLSFGKSMRWMPEGLRFARPVRWILAKLDSSTIDLEVDGVRSGDITFGHRFTHDLAIEVPDAGAYLGLVRNARVEPDQDERRRTIVAGLDRLGEWADPLGKLDEVVHMVESPTVLEGVFEERFLALPERVIVTAMQSHQRYFPLGGNRFAFVANGGQPDVVRAGNENVLANRLDDARFTFERDVARGIDELARALEAITFFAGAGSYAEKTSRVAALVVELGGDETAVQAATLAKADQAAELVREFPELEGHIGAQYARLAGRPEEVCAAIEDQYLPDAADAPLPSTPAGRVLAAADKIDTLRISFALGHAPTGSRDPFGLRRAAIGVCRLAVEGGVTIRREIFESDELRGFVEERLEGLLDMPVEFVRAARFSAAETLGQLAERAHALASLERERLAVVHEVYTRAARLAGAAGPKWHRDRLVEAAERELADAIEASRPILTSHDLSPAIAEAERLAPVVARFFDDVLVMTEDVDLRENRLALLADVRDAVGGIGDFSQIPL
jgi:tetrameric-type glycyl-tRNA synthetase beta subunit